MNKYYLIIEKSNNSYSIVDSLGTSQGINGDFIYNQQDTALVYKVQSASDVLHLASYIFTRRGDYNNSSHEGNKLYNSLKTYCYVSIPYNQLVTLSTKGGIDLKEHLISEEQFLSEIKNSDTMKSVLEMNTLTARKPREVVMLKVAFTNDNWCYTTDFYNEDKLVGKSIKYIKIPLDITTDMVNNYITAQLGVEYKFNF